MQTGLNRFDRVYFINLKHREDRLTHIQKELLSTNIDQSKIVRIDGVYIPNFGALGCSKSHIKALEDFVQTSNDVQHCIILEDDFTFTLPMEKINTLIDRLFIEVNDYDVVMFGYSLLESENMENDFLIKLKKVYTTSAYCVNKKFAQTLLDNYREGVEKLETEPSNKNFKIDVYFHSLMEKSNWYGFNPKIGLQKPTYSDVEYRYVVYNV